MGDSYALIVNLFDYLFQAKRCFGSFLAWDMMQECEKGSYPTQIRFLNRRADSA